MAELIVKKALIDKFEEVKWKCDKLSDVAEITGVQAVIDAFPTTTEAEIRAMAIDEFAEKLIALFCYEPPVPNKWKMDNIYEGESIKEIITEVAEQLKEE